MRSPIAGDRPIASRVALIAVALILCAAARAEARPVIALWDPTPDAFTVGYAVYIGTSSGDHAVRVEAGNALRADLDLAPGVTYFLVVYAYNAAGEYGPPSNEVAFTLPNSAPIIGNPGNLTITAGPLAAQLVATDPDGDPLTYSITGLPSTVVLNAATGVVSGSIAAGTYNVTIAASDGIVVSQQSFVLVVLEGPCTGAPNPATVQTPTVAGSLVTVSWTAPDTGPKPSTYVVQVGTTAGASNFFAADLGSAGTSASGQVPNGAYFLRLISRNGCGDSPASNEVTFRVGPAPPAAPTLSFQRSGNNVTLNWTAPSGTVTGYVIEAGSASGLSNIAVFATGNTATTFATPAPAGTYFVRVRASNSGGPGSASNEVIIVVP